MTVNGILCMFDYVLFLFYKLKAHVSGYMPETLDFSIKIYLTHGMPRSTLFRLVLHV